MEEQEIIAQLNTLFNNMLDGQATGLAGVRDLQLASQALLKVEEQRLIRKHGQGHPRLQRLRAQRLNLIQSARNLAVEADEARVRVPEVDATLALIQGRILDENRRGIGGLSVYVINPKGIPIQEIKPAVSDKAGYYAISYSPEALPVDGTQGMLVVETSSKKVIYQGEDILPLSKLSKGEQVNVDIRLDRSNLADIPIRAQPRTEETVIKETKPPPGRNANKRILGSKWFGYGSARENLWPVSWSMSFEKERNFDEKLASAITDEKGQYRVVYTKTDNQPGPKPDTALR